MAPVFIERKYWLHLVLPASFFSLFSFARLREKNRQIFLKRRQFLYLFHITSRGCRNNRKYEVALLLQLGLTKFFSALLGFENPNHWLIEKNVVTPFNIQCDLFYEKRLVVSQKRNFWMQLFAGDAFSPLRHAYQAEGKQTIVHNMDKRLPILHLVGAM